MKKCRRYLTSVLAVLLCITMMPVNTYAAELGTSADAAGTESASTEKAGAESVSAEEKGSTENTEFSAGSIKTETNTYIDGFPSGTNSVSYGTTMADYAKAVVRDGSTGSVVSSMTPVYQYSQLSEGGWGELVYYRADTVLNPGTYKLTASVTEAAEGYALPDALSNYCTLTVTKANTVITTGETDYTITYGDAIPGLDIKVRNDDLTDDPEISGADESTTVQYKLSSVTDEAYADLPDGSLNAGEYTLKISYAGNDYYEASEKEVSLTVEPVDDLTATPATVAGADRNEITVNTVRGQQYAVSATDSEPADWTANGIYTETAESGTHTFTGLEEDTPYYVFARNPGNGNHKATVAKTTTRTLAKAATHIDFSINDTVVFTAGEIYIIRASVYAGALHAAGTTETAVTTPAVTITYAVQEGQTGTIGEDKTVAPVKAGKYTATASFAGNDTYAASEASVNFSVEVKKTDTEIRFGKASYSYAPGDTFDVSAAVYVKGAAANADPIADLDPEISYVDTETGESKTFGGILSLFTDLGEYTATASFKGNDAYAAASATADISVALKKSETPTFAPDATVKGQTITVISAGDIYEYTVAKKGTKTEEIEWDFHYAGKGEKIVFEDLEPGTAYVVYVRNGGEEVTTLPSDPSAKTTTLTTQAFAKLTVSAKNGTVLMTGGYKSGDGVRAGTEIILTAVPDDGYYFAGWTYTNAENKKVTVTEEELDYKVIKVTGTEKITASFKAKAAATVSVKNTRFAYSEKQLTAEDFGITLKAGGKTVEGAEPAYINFYAGKNTIIPSAWMSDTPRDVGTYTAQVFFKEGDTYKAVTKNIVFTIVKAQLTAEAFVVTEADEEQGITATYENDELKITLKKEALKTDQQYALATGKTAKIANDDFREPDGEEDLEFSVTAGQKYYVITRKVTDDPSNEIDSKNVASAKTIRAIDARGISAAAAAAAVPALANTEKTVKVTVTNNGNAAEKIGAVTVTPGAYNGSIVSGDTSVSSYPAKVVGKTIKAGKSLTFDLKLKSTVSANYNVRVATTEVSGEAKTADVTVSYEVVENYSVDFDGTTVKDKVYNGKTQNPAITLKAAAADGTKIRLSDCTVKVTTRFGEEVTPKEAGIYQIVITVDKVNYTGTTILPYIIAQKAPAAVKKSDVTLDETSITLNKMEEGQEYALAAAGISAAKIAPSNWRTASDAGVDGRFTFSNAVNVGGAESPVRANGAYVLYNRTTAVDGDENLVTASAAKSCSLTTTAWAKVNFKANNKKYGTVKATTGSEPEKAEFVSGTEVSNATEITLTAEAEEGYYFTGWFIGKKLFKPDAEFTYKNEDSKNVTLVAKFAAKATPKITFNKNDLKTKEYNAEGYDVRATVKVGGKEVTEGVTVTYQKEGDKEALDSGVKMTDAGTYTITASYEGTAAVNAKTATATFTIKGTPVETPAAWEKGAKTVAADTTITIDNLVAGQKYLVTTASKVTAATEEDKWQTAAADTLTFEGLKGNTKYYVYTYIPAKGNDAASAVSKKSAAVKTLHSYAYSITDAGIYAIYGVEGKATNGTITLTVQNKGTDKIMIAKAVPEKESSRFTVTTPKSNVIKAGKSAKITVKVGTPLETKGYFEDKVLITLTDPDGNVLTDAESEDGYTAKWEVDYLAAAVGEELPVMITNAADPDGEGITVTATGKALAYSTRKISVVSSDGTKLTTGNALKVEYKLSTETEEAYTTTAPSETGIYHVKVSYNKTVNGLTYTGTNYFYYTIKGKTPAKAKVKVLGGAAIKITVVDGLEYQFVNTNYPYGGLYESGWCSAEELEELDGIWPAYPGAEGYIEVRVPAAAGDTDDITASDSAKTNFTCRNSTKVTLTIADQNVAYDGTDWLANYKQYLMDGTISALEGVYEDLGITVLIDGTAVNSYIAARLVEAGVVVKDAEGNTVDEMVNSGLYTVTVNVKGSEKINSAAVTATGYFNIVKQSAAVPEAPEIEAVSFDSSSRTASLKVTNAAAGQCYGIAEAGAAIDEINDEDFLEIQTAADNGDLSFSGLSYATEYTVWTWVPAGTNVKASALSEGTTEQTVDSAFLDLTAFEDGEEVEYPMFAGTTKDTEADGPASEVVTVTNNGTVNLTIAELSFEGDNGTFFAEDPSAVSGNKSVVNQVLEPGESTALGVKIASLQTTEGSYSARIRIRANYNTEDSCYGTKVVVYNVNRPVVSISPKEITGDDEATTTAYNGAEQPLAALDWVDASGKKGEDVAESDFKVQYAENTDESISNLNFTTTAPKNAGSYKVKISWVNEEYACNSTAYFNYTINKAEAVLTEKEEIAESVLTKEYAAMALEVTAENVVDVTANGVEAVETEAAANYAAEYAAVASDGTVGAYSTTAPTNAGAYKVKIYVDCGNIASNAVVKDYTIKRARVSLSPNETPQKNGIQNEYTGSALEVMFSQLVASFNSSSKLVNAEAGTYQVIEYASVASDGTVGTYSTEAPTEPGSYKVRVYVDSANISSSQVVVNYTITKVELTLTEPDPAAAIASQTAGEVTGLTAEEYLDAACLTKVNGKDITFKVEYRLTTGSDEDYTTSVPQEAGTYNVRISAAEDNAYYTSEPIVLTNKLLVNEAASTID